VQCLDEESLPNPSDLQNLVELGTISTSLKVNRQKKRLCNLILGVSFDFTPIEITEVRMCGKSVMTTAI